MEHALQLIIKAEELGKKVTDVKRFKGIKLKEKLQEKVEKGELTAQEMETLLALEHARWDAILVDEFEFDSMKKKTYASVIDKVESPLM
jgi:hypothetical protein